MQPLEDGQPVAVVDIGTNTASLLVSADRRTIVDEERFVRLGEDLGRTGRVGEAAIRRLNTALAAFRELIDSTGAQVIRAIGTSAAREAENTPDLAALVSSVLGVPLEVLSGEEEATFSFHAAASVFGESDSQSALAVVDIGGGSTEVATGTRDGAGWRLETRMSFPVGSVRLAERFWVNLPPSSSERAVAWETLCSMFSRTSPSGSALPLGSGNQEVAPGLVAIDGVARVLHQLEHQIRPDSGRWVTSDRIARWSDYLNGCTSGEVLDLDPDLLRGRADVFPMAVYILRALMDNGRHARCYLSDRSLRHGVAFATSGGWNNGPGATS